MPLVVTEMSARYELVQYGQRAVYRTFTTAAVNIDVTFSVAPVTFYAYGAEWTHICDLLNIIIYLYTIISADENSSSIYHFSEQRD